MTYADGWLTKAEVNALYYRSVAGEIVFGTEAQSNMHSAAVARLVAFQARRLGKREIRILEIGANDGAFARALRGELAALASTGESQLQRVDYLAVEFARSALDIAARAESLHGGGQVLRPTGVAGGERGEPTLVALVRQPGTPVTNIGLVHAEATRFLDSTDERFDFAILNELLDDLPGTGYYADHEGRRYEFAAHARASDEGWVVRISAKPAEDAGPEMPASTITARSPASVDVVTGVARLLTSHGLMVVHDYGFAGSVVPITTYEPLPRLLPGFARLELPDGSEQGFPRSFFRVYGNDAHRLVQITNDVNFDELAGSLRSSGAVITLPHGNAIANTPGFIDFARDDGVFLSEFGLLRPDDDLGSLFARLEREQAAMRARYIGDRMGGRESIFQDLVYVKR